MELSIVKFIGAPFKILYLILMDTSAPCRDRNSGFRVNIGFVTFIYDVWSLVLML
jgi:hypothetical protein